MYTVYKKIRYKKIRYKKIIFIIYEKKRMKISKEILIKIGIVILILIAIIYNFITSNSEEIEYTNIIVNTIEVNKEMEEPETIKVYVAGAVNTPGVIELEEGSRIEDAINLAGGITKEANLSQVNLAYKMEDGQKLYIPNINDKQIEYLTSGSGEEVVEDASKLSNNKVNINKAGVEELGTLQGVGEALAQRIVNYREENGKFKTIEDLKNVSGIGEKKFESIKENIEV